MKPQLRELLELTWHKSGLRNFKRSLDVPLYSIAPNLHRIEQIDKKNPAWLGVVYIPKMNECLMPRCLVHCIYS